MSKSPEEIFEGLVISDGGRLVPSAVPKEIAASLDYVAHRANGFLRSAADALPRMWPIHFDFVDHYEFNAFAHREGDQYFIGLYRGVISTLSLVFDRLLADRDVLPFLGDVTIEAENLPKLPALGPSFFDSVRLVEFFSPPRDATRRAVSKRLTEIALDFVVAHEFGHIASGHLEFLGIKGNLWRIAELSCLTPLPPDQYTALVRRTIETNADETATVFTLVTEWKRCLGLVPRRGPEWDNFYNHPGMITMLWAYAVGTVCRIFGDMRLSGPTDLYPSWRLRSVMIQQSVGRLRRPEQWIVQGLMECEDSSNVPPIVPATFRNVESDFAVITGLPISTQGLEDAWGEGGKSQASEIQQFWVNELRTKLQQFSWQPLDLFSIPYF